MGQIERRRTFSVRRWRKHRSRHRGSFPIQRFRLWVTVLQLERDVAVKTRDRRLVVGHAELEYGYEQLALIENLPSPDAARLALRRAVIRLGSLVRKP